MNSTGHSQPCLCSACDCEHSKHRPPLIQLRGVELTRGERSILTDVNMTVDRGDFIAVTGPNGGGKTSLLRIILGLLKPTRGTVGFFDAEGKPAPAPAFGYLPQKNSVDSHFPITVGEVVASGLLSYRNIDKAEKARRMAATLETIEMSHLADRPIGRLSGGQLQRALFGRAIVTNSPVLIMDEPLSYIDKHFEERMYAILQDLARTSTIILVSHEMSTIATMANRHIIVDRALHECTAHKHSFDCER